MDIRDGRLRGAHRARGNGIRRILQRYRAGRSAAVARCSLSSWIVSLVHLSGIKHSANFRMSRRLIKGALIIALIIAGLAYGSPQPISFAPSPSDLGLHLECAVRGQPRVRHVCLLRLERRDLHCRRNSRTCSQPAALDHCGDRSSSSPCYVALNAVFLYTTPIASMAGQLDVALIAGKHIFGDFGGRIVGALICIGLVSSISAMTWMGPRVTMAMGFDHALLAPLSRTTSDGVPTTAILLQLVIVSAAADDAELRGRARYHPIQPDALLVPCRARRHRAALERTRICRVPTGRGAILSRRWCISRSQPS